MKIKNINVNVNVIGNTGPEIIFLHGWGQDGSTFNSVVESLKENYKIYLIDLPGFGKSDEPKEVYDLDDYTYVLDKIIKTYNINKPLIIGHSFGGRVAIKHSSTYGGADKLILVNSAGIKNKRSLKYYYKVYSYKMMKHLLSLRFLKKYKEGYLNKYGSTDYKNASQMMKKVLIKVVNEDLSDHMKKVMIPVLLFWGENDTVTPIEHAYKMQEYFYDCGLVKVKNSGHFSYLDNPYLLAKVIESFH